MIGFFAGTGWSAYPPLSGIKYNPGSRGRLLAMERPGLRSWDAAFGNQFPSDHFEDALSWNDPDENADLCLGDPDDDGPRRICLSDLDGNRSYALHRPAPRHAYLYRRVRGQSDDVHQLVLGLGPSGSLHSRLTCIWDLLRDRPRFFP